MSDFAISVFNNIYTASPANVFKIENRLNLDYDKDGIELDKFLKQMKIMYGSAHACDDRHRSLYEKCVLVTEMYIAMIGDMPKEVIADHWILDIRKMYKETMEE